MKIVTVIGARPQFIKAAALSRAIAESNGGIQEVIIHTGQHFDENMSEVFFKEMNIPKPDYNLNVGGLSHGAMTGRMIEKIEEVLKKEDPDYLLVYGDTNSTLAGAIAAKKLLISVIHVEAGMRSFNNDMPEEINRILTDRISQLLFCSTTSAIENLRLEGFEKFPCHFELVGDIMEDVAIYYSERIKKEQTPKRKLDFGEYCLATVHRAENTDNPERLSAIMDAFNELSDQIKIVVPLHPRTRNILAQNKIKTDFTIIDPVGYLEMVDLISNCRLVLTDSGGLQKESYFFDKYCITLRDETEWVELVENGYNRIVGANKDLIIQAARELLNTKFIKKDNLYGGGVAAKKILDGIRADFSLKEKKK